LGNTEYGHGRENMNELIYVADDDKEICKLLKTHIENEGYKVEVFLNGQDLLNRFAVQQCDLTITDIAMPKMNGYDLCREIRKTSIIPIFMISANNDEIDRVLGLELGSDDYIAKPIGFRELIVKIKNTFKRIELYNTPQTCEKGVLRCKDISLSVVNREVKFGLSTVSRTDFIRYGIS
jgi:DNA-binding response OmpR family regulator